MTERKIRKYKQLKLFSSTGWLDSHSEELQKGANLRVSGCLLGGFHWRISRPNQLVGDSRTNPEHAGEMIYLIWPGNAAHITQEELEDIARKMDVWTNLLSLLPL